MRWRSRAESNSVICLLQGLIIAPGLSELLLPTQSCTWSFLVAVIPKVPPQQTLLFTHTVLCSDWSGESLMRNTKPKSVYAGVHYVFAHLHQEREVCNQTEVMGTK